MAVLSWHLPIAICKDLWRLIPEWLTKIVGPHHLKMKNKTWNPVMPFAKQYNIPCSVASVNSLFSCPWRQRKFVWNRAVSPVSSAVRCRAAEQTWKMTALPAGESQPRPVWLAISRGSPVVRFWLSKINICYKKIYILKTCPRATVVQTEYIYLTVLRGL